jgi:hypothetical protein
MVLQRHIDNLKERPHHERRAVALTIAIGVVIVLFVGWAFIFFTELHANDANDASDANAADAQTPAAGQNTVAPSTTSSQQ